MSEAANNDKPEKAGTKKNRYILYALILLALAAWLLYENSAGPKALKPASTETNVERTQETETCDRRLQAAYALVKQAGASGDEAEQIRLYDEIINTYQADTMPRMPQYVAWAMYKKARLEKDDAEKSRQLDELIDRYLHLPDKNVAVYVLAALRERVNLAGSGAEKTAFCDELLEKLGGRLPDSVAAWLLNEKAEYTPSPADRIAIYDMMLDRFLASDDDSAFDLTIVAALDKMELITDQAEQIRLCDIAIEAFLKTPQRTRYYLFDTAARKKAKLVNDPDLPLQLYNQVIAANVTEESVVQARSMRMPLLKDDDERLAACDEFIAAHQASRSDFVQLMVARTMARKADLLPQINAKAELFRSIIEKCASIEDTRARDLANETIVKLAELSGDPTIATRYYDQETATAKNELDAILALRSKAWRVKSPAEKISLYDEIIARGGNSDDNLVSREVIRAIQDKANLTENREEKIKLYDEAIARSEHSSDARVRAGVADIMMKKARHLDGREAKISLYDDIIARGLNSGSKEELRKATLARHEKAKITDDKAEKIKLYDLVLSDILEDRDQFALEFILNQILRERINLADEEPEKLRLYEHYLTAAGSAMNPGVRRSLLLDKAGITSDPAGRARLYKEIIELCERDLQALESGPEDLVEFKRASILSQFAEAILGQAGLEASNEEKIKLYDRYLAFPQVSRANALGLGLEKILAQKAELSGDPAVKTDYFDRQIQAAGTDRQRVNWYARKAEAAGNMERPAIEEEMIAKYFDSTDEEIEGVIARALLGKIGRAADSAEAGLLCDRLIQRYGGSTGSQVEYAVVRAFIYKAKATDDDEMKLKLYSSVIERYQDNDDYLVKRLVDEAIAARFRLEMKAD